MTTYEPGRAPKDNTALVMKIVGGVISVLMVLIFVRAATSPRSPVVAAPSVQTTQDAIHDVLAQPNAAAAFAKVRPVMVDAAGRSSHGTVLFDAWARQHMKWSDVGVAVNETSFARISKDVDDERGKRICISGDIVQINVSKTEYGKGFDGILVTAMSSDPWFYHAVRSTGDLVAPNVATFCGIVTGIHSYANAAGKTINAPDIVGMFDLPENR